LDITGITNHRISGRCTMQVVYIDAKFSYPIALTDECIKILAEQKSTAIFAATQFTKLDTVFEQLKQAQVQVSITKAKRTHVPLQILGCDAYHDAFETDIFAQTNSLLYIGDGLFHPKALLLAQIYHKSIKPVIMFDPVTQKTTTITKEDIQAQIDQMRVNLKKYINAQTIGILVTVKPGQQYLENAKKLKEHLIKQGKKAYIFIDDDIQLFLLENYPFIQCWVNTACPRIGLDDHVTIRQPLINIREALKPIESLEKLIF
jgi:2-(3-amino-3-carboxypropyl)histidine synthase